MISGTITDASGRTLSGQTVEAFYTSIAHARPIAVGLNCALGARQLRGHIADLARITELPVIAYPNAGLPNEFGGYDETPETTAELLKAYARDGIINVAGGCCGTTPAHVQAIAAAVAGLPPRVAPTVERRTRLSGLQALAIPQPGGVFVNVGERTNVTGSRKFARLILEDRFEEGVEVARQQVEAGAQLIDVNMDEAMLDSVEAMTRFLSLIAAEPDISARPGHDRFVALGRDRGRAQVRPGQVGRQLDLAQGGRGPVPRARPPVPPLRRGGRRHGLRRAGPGGHGRPQGRGRPAAPTGC